MWARTRAKPGFTIVELLIVIIVIGILAAITIASFSGTQQRARDTQRQSDVRNITQALEQYYADNGQFPGISNPDTGVINSSWATTADSSWSLLETALKPYLTALPRDPVSTQGVNILTTSGSYGYAYYADKSGVYCNTSPGQMFVLVYRMESTAQPNTLIGTCGATNLGPYNTAGSTTYRVVK